MFDPRIKKLAFNLVNYSCRVQKGENVLIESTGENDDLVKALIKEVYAVGANPFYNLNDSAIQREFMLTVPENSFR